MAEHLMIHDIVDDHVERIQNIRKYYPFFKLMETSFSQYKEGRYECLDMGYITLAILRFFIEENNFKEKPVIYPEYAAFMRELLRRDFQLFIEEQEEEELLNYIFEKVKNDGKPFTFTFYDPLDRKKKTTRIRLLESKIQDNILYYHISSQAIAFYLDTKEVQDESSINMDQLLLEKLIHTQNFRGAVDVVRRINNEVSKLQYRKEEVLHILSYDVFEGIKAYENFVENGTRWFQEEQKLFHKNTQLIQKALERASADSRNGEYQSNYYKAIHEIYSLELELKKAMQKHSELLQDCTQLQIRADEMVAKSKLQALRNTFDFQKALQYMMVQDRPDLLANLVHPLLGLHTRKTFSFTSLDDLLTYRADPEEKGETVQQAHEENYIYEDELEDARIQENYRWILQALSDLFDQREQFALAELNEELEKRHGAAIFRNGDYYSFLVHLCQKKTYDFRQIRENPDTFLEEMIRGYLERSELPDAQLHFTLEQQQDPITLMGIFEITNVVFRKE